MKEIDKDKALSFFKDCYNERLSNCKYSDSINAQMKCLEDASAELVYEMFDNGLSGRISLEEILPDIFLIYNKRNKTNV